jgi:hypothetical protein
MVLQIDAAPEQFSWPSRQLDVAQLRCFLGNSESPARKGKQFREQIAYEFIRAVSGAADVQPLCLPVAWEPSLLAAALCDTESEIALPRSKSVRY